MTDSLAGIGTGMPAKKLTNENAKNRMPRLKDPAFEIPLPKYLPNEKPVIRKGYPHCGYMAAHTKEYVEEMESFITKR